MPLYPLKIKADYSHHRSSAHTRERSVLHLLYKIQYMGASEKNEAGV